MKVIIINGPNINFLGIRNKKEYGDKSYSELNEILEKKARELGIELEIFQSNSEGSIIDRLQKTYYEDFFALIINPAAYTHYSYAIRDCLEFLKILKIEVHFSDISKREEFRKLSVISDVCDKTIMGEGINSYIRALEYIKENGS